MASKYHSIAIALAGMFQAATLTRQLARTGKTDPMAFETSIRSIFIVDPKTTTEVYGHLIDLRLGFNELLKTLEPSHTPDDPEARYYLVSLVHLERQLAKNAKLWIHLSRRIRQAITQLKFFPPTHAQVLANLADIYSETLGTLKYRIKVVGSAGYIGNGEIMHKIRALLLAGIRATILWRQVGGSRLQLFFSRKLIVQTAKEILRSA